MDRFVSMTEAAKLAGTSRIVLRQRVRRGELQTFRHPLDDRVRLIKVGDLDRLRQPRPVKLAAGSTGDAPG